MFSGIIAAVLTVVVVTIARISWRKKNPRAAVTPVVLVAPAASTANTTVTVEKKEEKKKWEWKKYEWLIPIVAWALLLLTFELTFPDQFWAWAYREHWQVFLATNVALLGIGVVWYKKAGNVGRKLATLAFITILGLAYAVHYDMIPRELLGWNWKEVKRALMLPTSTVNKAPVRPGVPWTPAWNKENKDAYLCSLRPGETSAVRPTDPRPFAFSADSDLIIIVNGKETFFPREKHLSKQECIALGTYGRSSSTLQFKNPEKEDILVSIVYQ